MSDWKDDKEKLFNESINGVKEVTVGMLYGDRIESLLSKQKSELVEKVEKIDFKQGYTEESQPIFEHGQIEARDQVIALIKDTNEVAEEEENK